MQSRESGTTHIASMRTLFKKQWFLICLALVLFVGFSFPRPLEFLADTKDLRNVLIAVVLFMTALVLETSEIWKAVKRPRATILAVALNYGLLPIVAWGFARWFLDGQLAVGVMVAAAAPCTLASAAVWTRRGGGNDAVAIMVTVVTNLGCFVMTPLWLAAMAGQTDVPIEIGPMIWKLAWLVVLPMLMGQALRQNTAVAAWAANQKTRLSAVAQMGILFIVFTGAVGCGLEIESAAAGGVPWGDFARMTFSVAGIHAVVLVTGQVIGRRMGCPRGDWIAVGFAGSQKTLPVGLQVASMLGGGMMILPIVTYHVMQLLIDTLVADRLVANLNAG